MLLCAPSNAAVDNLLTRLAPAAAAGELTLVRVGHTARVPDALLRFTLDGASARSNDGELVDDIKEELGVLDRRIEGARGDERRALRAELRQLQRDLRSRQTLARRRVLAHADVVLSTCVSSGTRSLADAIDSSEWRRSPDAESAFDVAIIDEAAQSTEAACWVRPHGARWRFCEDGSSLCRHRFQLQWQTAWFWPAITCSCRRQF